MNSAHSIFERLFHLCLSVIFLAGFPHAKLKAQESLMSTQNNVVSQPAREIDDQHGFRILVWQYKTEARRDQKLYEKVHLKSWHIDRGNGKQNLANWAGEKGWPYYVDHAAGKGILHLTPRSGLDKIPRDGRPAVRPWSFHDPETVVELKRRISSNLPAVVNGPVLAIALDDEVSNGSFNTPFELDYSEPTLRAFSNWLPNQYDSRSDLNKSWGSSNRPYQPKTYEAVRKQIQTLPPAKWKLSPWLDFRMFMDGTQSHMFAELVRHANGIAPGVPAGVVGGQQPSAYGGFDYSRLRNSLQWIEAYDIGGTNEILRSFWAQTPRRGRMQTYFLSGKLSADKWFLWYYLAHGCRSVIAWPDRNGKAWFHNGNVSAEVARLGETFREVQSDRLAFLAHPDTKTRFSPIGILYSQPSNHVGWAIDAAVHGKTWPRRSSSLDNSCLSSGKSRVAWSRLMEDLGYQPRFIDTQELVNGFLAKQKVRVLVLPQSFALSKKQCNAIERFVVDGGHVIADYGTAITDTHGNGYDVSPLDKLFGIDRKKDQGWLDGKSRTVINGEKYQRPFLERLVRQGTFKDQGEVVVERTLTRTWIKNQIGSGTTLFLNSSPIGYFDWSERSGQKGNQWRLKIGDWLKQKEVGPLVSFAQSGQRDYGIEVLGYETAEGKDVLVFVANPTRQAAVDGAGSGLSISGQMVEIKIQTGNEIRGFVDLRTGKPVSSPFRFPLDEALVLEVRR